MATQHLFRFIDQPLGLGDAFSHGLLTGLDLTSVTLPLFGSLFLLVGHLGANVPLLLRFNR